MPEGMGYLSHLMFSQGYQQPPSQGVWGTHPTTSPTKTGRSQDPKGVWDVSMSTRFPASLFMDDTTILAKSESGLADYYGYHICGVL